MQNVEKTPVQSTASAGSGVPMTSAQLVEAYQRRLEEILAVPESEFATINVDIPTAVTTVLGALPEILQFRDGMKAITGVNQKAVDGLRDYALAAAQAHSVYTVALTPQEDLAELNDRALRVRDVMRTDAAALANRGLIDPARLAPFKNAIGYKNIAFELINYANLFASCWDKVGTKTALDKNEIEQARILGEQLMFAVGQREQAPAVIADVTRIRQQAYTLFFSAYSEVRRTLQFLRYYEDDVDSIAPSLFAGRGGRKPAGADGALPAGTLAAVVTPAAAPVAPATTAEIPPGMPGARPFTN